MQLNSEIMIDNKMSKKSRLFCPVERSITNIFFSLTDYRNNYFTSDELIKIFEFYEGFDNRDQLIKWMKERPKGVANIHEVEGDKDIIVVITTADFNGKYAKECRENIFKGSHMVFVESGGREDFYFNYSHNCNVGIRRAMEHHPKWVVISNDDMVLKDSLDKLKEQLNLIDEDKDVVFSKPSEYHSFPVWISKMRLKYYIRLTFSRKEKLLKLFRKFNIKHSIRFKVLDNKSSLLYHKLYFKDVFSFDHIGCFSIFSATFINKSNNTIFDETYINNFEDVDVSFKLFKEQKTAAKINYTIGDMVGGTLGTSIQRDIRAVASEVYFSYKNLKGIL